MASSHGYRIFGLNVRSDLEIRHWPAGSPPWDVRIVRGDVPRELPGTHTLWEGVFQGGPGRCLLRYPGAGDILVEDGNRLTVATTSRRTSSRLAHVLGATAFAAVLYQRGLLCLHASAVAWRGHAYLVMGPSGAGKSTTASAVLAQGGEFISDDLTAVIPGPGGKFIAVPSFPSMRLHGDAHEEMAGRIAAHGARETGEQKIRLEYTGAMARQPLPIARICYLEHDEALARPHLQSLVGQERLAALHRSLFRRRMARILIDPTRLAELMIAFAPRVEVVRLTRPRHIFSVDEVCDLLLA